MQIELSDQVKKFAHKVSELAYLENHRNEVWEKRSPC